MFLPDPGSCFLSISDLLDPKTATKERGEKKFVVLPFFVATKITKLEKKLFFNWCRKNLGQELFTQKLSLSSQKYRFGIRDQKKTYSGSRIQGSKRHWIPDPQPWLRGIFVRDSFLKVAIIYVTGIGKQRCGSRLIKSESRSRIS